MTELNAAGDALLAHYEGDKLTAYLDIAGIWTIGRGHVGPDVHPGLVWTQAQSDAAYAADKAKVIEAVEQAVAPVVLNENQLAGCVVLAYNIGDFAFHKSEVAANIRKGDFQTAAKCFQHWDHAHVKGKLVEVDGLLRRRLAESHLFLTPIAKEIVLTPATDLAPAVTQKVDYVVSSEMSGAQAQAAPAPISTTVTAGTVIAGVAGVVQQSVDKLQPIHDGLLAAGYEPRVILAGLTAILLGSLGYVGYAHFKARKVGVA